MDSTFVAELANRTKGPQVIDPTSGRIVAPQGWIDLTPKKGVDETLEVFTLTGLDHFINENVDELNPSDLLIHVRGPGEVHLRSKLEPGNGSRHRHLYVRCSIMSVGPPFGRFIGAEEFSIWLQTCFVSTPALEEIRVLIASIRESDVRETVDDGVAQEVKTANGVTLVNRTKVPNPVSLRPYRTFREIVQPESPFVLRLRSGADGGKPTCALFEADGGVWGYEAISSIKKWLDEKNLGVAIVA